MIATDRAPDGFVECPRGGERADGDRDADIRRDGESSGVHQQCSSAEIVDHDEKRGAAQPCGVRLPLEPVQRLGQGAGAARTTLPLVLLDEVEAAAVDQPDGAVAVGLRPRAQVAVEPVEEHGIADPHDPGDHVHPAAEQVEPFERERAHGARRIAGGTSEATSLTWPAQSPATLGDRDRRHVPPGCDRPGQGACRHRPRLDLHYPTSQFR